MERKIGEIFEYNGEWYQCVEEMGCGGCAFDTIKCDEINDIVGHCPSGLRHDDKSVVFKKLEKAGEPFTVGRELCQHYKVFDIDNVCGDVSWNVHNYKAKTILIELKQNKENMEEGNNTKHSNSENIGKNLKPFDLQAAKSGKPVCTRSGKPVRIICFDVKGAKHPIIALVKEEDEYERVCSYMPDGRRFNDEEEWPDDLMMLPEKKEGWVNLYRDEESKRVYCGEFIFSEREKAEKHYECNDTKVATVSIGWEE